MPPRGYHPPMRLPIPTFFAFATLMLMGSLSAIAQTPSVVPAAPAPRLSGRSARRIALLHRRRRPGSVLLDRPSRAMGPRRAGHARPRRPGRHRASEAGTRHRRPAALGHHRESRLRLGRLDLPARRLRHHDGGRRHRAAAQHLRAAFRSGAAHDPARAELRRRGRLKGGRAVRHRGRPARPVRRRAADQRRAGRRLRGL
jgi:hypothetical protein